MVAAIVPAFATDASSGNNTATLKKNHKTTNLTDTQLAKLNLTQTK